MEESFEGTIGYIITDLPSGICNANDKTELLGYVIKLGSNTNYVEIILHNGPLGDRIN